MTGKRAREIDGIMHSAAREGANDLRRRAYVRQVLDARRRGPDYVHYFAAIVRVFVPRKP